MNEYISREDYCEENCGKENREGYKTCKNCGMLNIPTADVQSVVYCKDCKYAQNPNDTMVYCTYFECGTMSQNDFCSQGERRC